MKIPKQITVKSVTVTREYTLEDKEILIKSTHAPFMATLLSSIFPGAPDSFKWSVPYSDVGLSRESAAKGLLEMVDGALVQNVFTDLDYNQLEMLLDPPELRLK